MPAAANDKIDRFFKLYPAFHYDRRRSSCDEYIKLCRVQGWRRDSQGNYSPEQKDAWKTFRIAVVETFNACFGEDANDNESWGRLCVQLGITPIPPKLKDRRQVRITVYLCAV